MPQGISPNPLNKISEVYLSQISEHHKKDADGNTIPHEDEVKLLDERQKDSDNQRLSQERGRSNYGKASIRNMRAMGIGGNAADPADRLVAMTARHKEHEAKRGVKTKGMKKEEVEVDEAMKPSGIAKKAKLGAALDRLQALKVAKKKREMGEGFSTTGMAKGSGKPSGVMKDFLDKKAKKLEKQRAAQSQAARNNPAFDSTQPSPRVKMEALSNWKEDYVWEDEEQVEKEVKEKKVKNKIIINPKLGEAVEELGGQLLDVQEMSGAQGAKEDDPQLKSKMLRQRQLKKQVLLRKLQAVRQTGGEDIVASYEPEGEQVDEVIGKLAGFGALAYATKQIASKLGTMHGNRQVNQALSKSPATSNSSSSSGGSNFQRGVDAIKDAKKSGTGLMNKSTRDALKMLDQYEPEGEQLDEYGNPRVGVRLRVARAIDKVNPKPKMGSKRTAISNKLKMSAIKAETKRREQKENPYSAGKKVRMALGMSNEDYIPEEGYDHYKDRIAMAGGDPSSPDKKDATTMPRKSEPMKGMTAAQKAAKGKSALDIVKADIRKKYGKGAIMGEAKVDKDMIFGKSAARNERRFGKKGHFDPSGSGPRGQGTSERAQLAVKRGEEHKARRGVKTKGMGV